MWIVTQRRGGKQNTTQTGRSVALSQAASQPAGLAEEPSVEAARNNEESYVSKQEHSKWDVGGVYTNMNALINISIQKSVPNSL